MSNMLDQVWVLGEAKRSGELPQTVFELSAKARELADGLQSATGRPHRVSVVLPVDSRALNELKPDQASKYGADRVLVVSGEGLPMDRAAAGRVLAHLAEGARPKIILAAATAFGRSVMPYAAALLKTGLTADCTGLDIDPASGLLLQTRPAIGGNIMATIKTPNHMPQMASVRPKTFRVPPPDENRTCEVVYPDVPKKVMEKMLTTVKFEEFKEEHGSLQEREAIVSGGKGLRKAEGFDLIFKLADLLGAGVGASRPVVEMKWIAYQHQIGLSGQVVSPKIYIAAGISGSVQHLAGMQTSGKIIAIDRDPEAQIFKVADLAICGDLYEIIPALIKKIEQRRGLAR
jgi:electron transfer flavoprotein alpha subunit